MNSDLRAAAPDQCLDQLMTEADDLIDADVTADHPFRQTRLKRLIDYAAAPSKIDLAPVHEIIERRLLDAAAALRLAAS